MDLLQEYQTEIERLRIVIRKMEEDYVKYPFLQGNKVFGIAAYWSLGKIIYVTEQCYYIAPYRSSGHVVRGLMGDFKTVKDVFKAKEEAEGYIKENNHNVICWL